MIFCLLRSALAKTDSKLRFHEFFQRSLFAKTDAEVRFLILLSGRINSCEDCLLRGWIA